MKTSYKFQFNNWELSMFMNIPFQKITNDTIELNISIVGCKFEKTPAVLDLTTRELVSEKEFLMKPYKEEQIYKSTKHFIVPSEVIKQIKVYLS